jgi:serine/threonine protein kinase
MPPSQASKPGERPPAFEMSGTGAGVPETIGRYRLLAKIAKGGMAEVFAARSYGAHGFEKTVALKRILPKFGRDPQFVRMMVDEAKISVLLNHPNIAQVFELGEQDGDYFIVMEFVPGQSLAALIKRLKEENGRVPILEACFIVVELLQGLHAAHIQRDASGAPAHIIHRDVSPQNTLVSFDGHVKVIDFGIARARDRLEATEIGTIKGKLRYLAPEMIDPGRFTKEGDFDHRVDVFAAGIVLWELIAGRPLFPGDDEMKVYDDITDGVTPDLVKEGRCDAALMKIIHKALERRLERRYSTAEAFADELRAYVYRNDPAFTHKRVAAILDKVFPEEKAEALALERGGLPGQSGSMPRHTAGSASPDRPLPQTAPDGHTRSDRQLAARAVPIDDAAATAIADGDAVDPRNELGRQRDVTVMTLVSREAVLAGGKAPSDSSGVFSGVDDATLTVSADALHTLKGTVSARAPAGPPPPAPRVERPVPRGASMSGRPVRPDETPLTVRQPPAQPPAPVDDRARHRLIAASAVVGVVIALGIVALLDRLDAPPTPPPPVATTTTPTPTPPALPARVDVTLTSPTPGARIDAGGRQGASPLIVSVDAGTGLEVVVSAPGMATQRRRLEVGDAPLTLDVPLVAERVPLILQLDPADATVSVDGVPIGPDASVPYGPVSVVVSAPGHLAQALSLVAEAGVPLVVKATLERATPTPTPTPPSPPPTGSAQKPKPTPAVVGKGTLTIKSSPLWGKVTIDGKTYDDTTPLTVTLSAGRHDVVVAHPPRNLVRRAKVMVEADKTTIHSVTFE